MDQKRMGTFIAEQRHQRGMTQKELAERIGVSDKTISKWECGNSIPDLSYLQSICSSLDVSMNELLSGEKLSKEDYSLKAEANIMALIKENESSKKKRILEIALSILLILAFVIMSQSLLQDGNAGRYALQHYIDVRTLFLLGFLAAAEVLLVGAKTKAAIVALLRKVIFPNALLLFVSEVMLLLARMSSPGQLGPSLMVALVNLLYSAVFYIAVILWEHRTG